MSDITARRINLQIEEMRYRASVSEATMTRVGSAVNFINTKQYDSRGFFLNGPYGQNISTTGPLDGAWGVLFDCEIIGVMAFNIVDGSSGQTIFDVRRFTATNTGNTSIFSQKPVINSTALGNAYVFVDTLNNIVLENPAGTTVPILSTTQLNAGDMLVFRLDDYMLQAQNCGLILYYRPR
jgi:hypothetical protein